MRINFGREICGDLWTAEQREWLVTNGIGGYACGTIAGVLTRHYHGLLIAALHPPVDRNVLVTKLDESVTLAPIGLTSSGLKAEPVSYELFADRWADGSVHPHGYRHIEQFCLEGTTPVWTFACADVLLEKRIWMQQGANTTYIQYTLNRAQAPIDLTLKAMVNYRSHHNSTMARGWQMDVDLLPSQAGVRIIAFDGAVPINLFLDRSTAAATAQITLEGKWRHRYELAIERYRGIPPQDDHLHGATFQVRLWPGQSVTIIATTTAKPQRDAEIALAQHQRHDQLLLDLWHQSAGSIVATAPNWMEQLILAADQFVVDRVIPDLSENTSPIQGKTVIAGYPWFGDWGRDTMISLPGLTIATGRPDIARPILQTFGRYLDQGMLPNMFPDEGAPPTYNTVDATLWYFEALRAYYAATGDDALVKELFPALEEVIDWHVRGTRYQIHLDRDGLIYAGEPGVQLTWMDAKVGDYVVTPRIGKPIEINALWYNALNIMVQFGLLLGQPIDRYLQLAQQTREGFQQFWNPELRYCYDVLDTPEGTHDVSLRPNQIFAISLLYAGANPALNSPNGRSNKSSAKSSDTLTFQQDHSQPTLPLLTVEQQRSIVDTCGRALLTSYGLRSLAPSDRQYQGHYGGNVFDRDGAYHQGTVWGWLIGPFVQAHFNAYGDAKVARSFLEPMANHLQGGCVGTLSEIFDGDAPMTPRGAYAQAWTVAEVLRVMRLLL